MLLEKGCVVRSVAGHDKGEFLVCVAVDERFAMVVDGRQRPLAKPKKKNLRHLQMTTCVATEESMRTDKQLRRLLAAFTAADGPVTR